MHVRQFRTGGDRNFGYLVADESTGDAAVIDVSYDPSMIAGYARQNGFTIRYLFSTHSHHDHVNGNDEMTALTGCVPLLYATVDPVTGVRIEHGAVLPLGKLSIKVLHTPGHTEDSICLLAGDAVFTGDTLFVGKVGGTVDRGMAETEYRSLQDILMSLDDATRVFPGHDYGSAPQSTISGEKQSNPFLLQPDLESFIHLKENWAEYKRRHAIA
ncbi:hydroxyacylglutathione hydrolase family protein [Prosthecochloris sp. HL-130-GSB]|jgi:hydroxyacylglutathione hydrolase|nr:hydroxyacylglutathione hydrolase family protein [Prosthecochloris sp. HL-130-GSB]ARM30180.1 MBL fold metallo-hydrolase [Prosthecochloris sp. HL-130-GSB]